MTERKVDVVVVGGGTGGVAAALAAASMGCSVIMTDPTDWIGGQLTAQAVPPDEHPWIESHGATNAYRRFADGVRQYYRRHYPMTAEARATVHLNPGGGYVSRLCHEPRVALAVLESMLAPYRSNGLLSVTLETEPVAVHTDGDRVEAVTLLDRRSGAETVVTARYVIDATELGDVLALGDVEHVIGAESQAETGELHALEGDSQPLDQQALSWCFALDHLPGEDHTIDKPEDYDFWRTYQADFWPGPMLSWRTINPITLESQVWPIFTTDHPYDLWRFRRIVDRSRFENGAFASDITLVNWPQIDYWLGPIVGVDPAEAATNLERCRGLSLSFLHWMQTEAPRHDGGHGYPGLRLRPEIVGTADGLAKHVYVRESRRIRAEFTVLEQHVGTEQRGQQIGAEPFPDSVGTGSYRIDLHPSTAPRTYVDISCYPFQIPLGSLIPVRVDNLLPAAKNLGVTHITNGCYRLQPVEWNIGEVAGALAAHCVARGLSPRQVRNTEGHLREFQGLLRAQFRIPLEWPEFARVTAL